MKQAITKVSAMSQVISVPGEHMGPYAGCLADEADLTRRAAILAPTAGGKQFISDFTTVILKGPQSETPHKHMVRVSLLSLLPGTGNTQQTTHSEHGERAFPSYARVAEGHPDQSPSAFIYRQNRGKTNVIVQWEVLTTGPAPSTILCLYLLPDETLLTHLGSMEKETNRETPG